VVIFTELLANYFKAIESSGWHEDKPPVGEELWEFVQVYKENHLFISGSTKKELKPRQQQWWPNKCYSMPNKKRIKCMNNMNAN